MTARADEGVLVNISHHLHGGSLQPHFHAMGTLVGLSQKRPVLGSLRDLKYECYEVTR